MKKILICVVSIVLAIIGFIGGVYYESKKEFDTVQFDYWGIDGSKFEYNVNSFSLDFSLNKESAINNGDVLTLTYKNSTLGFITFKKDIKVEGLLVNFNVDKDPELMLLQAYAFSSQHWLVKLFDNGLMMKIIEKQKDDNYTCKTYTNLYISNGVPVQLIEGYKPTTQFQPTTITEDIKLDQLDGLIKAYIDDGFKQMK